MAASCSLASIEVWSLATSFVSQRFGPCLVHLKTKKISIFSVTSNLVAHA